MTPRGKTLILAGMGFWSLFPTDRLLAEGSLWSADYTNFGGELRRLDPFIDMYHVDVSDAHFVPGLLFFPALVAGLRPLTERPFHAHLMTEDPLPLIDEFADAGADMITVHCENGHRVPAAFQRIRDRGIAAGLGLGLDSPLESAAPWLEQVDLVLLMGTPMGVKGCDLSPDSFDRIRRLKAILADRGASGRVKIESDGGIRAHTVPGLRAAGADIVVMGSLAFRSADLDETFGWIRSLG